ncbi:MAG: hypothetical protein KAT91_00510 [Candidatus Aenigmarchaeota archaeon]|nr:hypothetical protein [Candidatus Aenigmarchaeota archaeon]
MNQDITQMGNDKSDIQFYSEYIEENLKKPELSLINKFNELATSENSSLTPEEVYGVLTDNNIPLKVQEGTQQVAWQDNTEDILKKNQEFDISDDKTLSKIVEELETLTKKKSSKS